MYPTITYSIAKDSKSVMHEITYGFHATRFGFCLIALLEQKVCFLGFSDLENDPKLLQDLHEKWPKANLLHDIEKTSGVAQLIFSTKDNSNIAVFLKGTDFQIKVWHELVKIPSGSVCSYQEIACRIGKPKAVRAVANAIAHNAISYLIPCHRVIRKSGNIHNYRWGHECKKMLIEFEKTTTGSTLIVLIPNRCQRRALAEKNDK